jgi:hypothetical protein
MSTRKTTGTRALYDAFKAHTRRGGANIESFAFRAGANGARIRNLCNICCRNSLGSDFGPHQLDFVTFFPSSLVHWIRLGRTRVHIGAPAVAPTGVAREIAGLRTKMRSET